jgi:hypothetical protein
MHDVSRFTLREGKPDEFEPAASTAGGEVSVFRPFLSMAKTAGGST